MQLVLHSFCFIKPAKKSRHFLGLFLNIMWKFCTNYQIIVAKTLKQYIIDYNQKYMQNYNYKDGLM